MHTKHLEECLDKVNTTAVLAITVNHVNLPSVQILHIHFIVC